MSPNAIILTAGTSSRFVPLSWECPKGLLEVRGEILIERQIKQLIDAGITDVTIVTGYMSDQFAYLAEKFHVDIVFNKDYDRYNNISSLICVVDRLADTFICSSDNYFKENVFSDVPSHSYYSAVFEEGDTPEYCLTFDGEDNITHVSVGGKDAWCMRGHVYFSREFSGAFRDILLRAYQEENFRMKYWEDVYIQYINQLPPLKVRRYHSCQIYEFDTLDELRLFDNTYCDDTRSSILRKISDHLHCSQSEFHTFKLKDAHSRTFVFYCGEQQYLYTHATDSLTIL